MPRSDGSRVTRTAGRVSGGTRFRILMHNSYFPPEYSGAALQAITLAKQLRERGHRIEFVTQRWPGLAIQDEVEGFPVTRLEAGQSGKHRELRLWWNLARLLRRRRADFDFLHSHGAYYINSMVGPLARHYGMKSLVKASLANNDLRTLGRSLVGRAHLRMLRCVDACIAISRDLEREYVTGGVPAERVHYLPNGVDVARFHPATPEEKRALRAKLGLPTDRAIALYMGVFDGRKHIDWLMRQWQQAAGFGLNALLLAVGPQSREDPDGSFKRELIELAERRPELLRVSGEVKDAEVYYRAADVFVLPSQNEGLPNALLEAMACGLPCVAADVSGTRELVVQGHTGYLFKPDDVSSLRAALGRGLDVGGLELGRAARARVEQEFAIRSLALRYERLYARLLEGSGDCFGKG